MSETGDHETNEENFSDEQMEAKTPAHEEEVVEEVETLEKKHDEVDYKAKFYYLAAELENLNRRHEREKQNLLKYGNEKLLSSLIEVFDNFSRSLEAMKKDAESDERIKNIFTGVEMVGTQFFDVLKQNGVEEVKTEGENFDPNFHEALVQQEVKGKKEGEIVSVFQKGFILNGRLIRAAKVIVAK